MKSMRILFVINGLAGGGAEKLMNDMLPLINGDTYTCDLLILTDKGQKYLDSLRSNGIKVTVVPDKYHSHIRRIGFIKRFIKQGNYDIVHANLFPVTYYCSIIKKFNRRHFPNLVMTEHSTDNRRRHHAVLRIIERFIYSSYDCVISISDQVQEQLVHWLKKPCGKTNFTVIYNGIDLERFEKAKAYKRTDLVPQLTEKNILLCVVGSFAPHKNQKIMLEAMAQLPEKYKLLLIGEGPLQSGLEQQAKDMNLLHRVFFLGFRRDVAEIMKTSDIIAVPSSHEGFGLVAVEAMACGKPVVVSDVPGLREVAGEAGIKCDPNDHRSFADAIVRLETQDVYEEYCLKSLALAHKFDIKNTANEYCNIFGKCV